MRIKLVTGRHHQIRVQMSHAGMSLLGDYKYADGQTKKLFFHAVFRNLPAQLICRFLISAKNKNAFYRLVEAVHNSNIKDSL